MSNIQKYLPTIYDGVLEMEAITSIEDELFEEISSITDKTVLNQYIYTSDIDGILRFEKMFGILANPVTETLEFRQNRLINRLSAIPPFTIKALRDRLNNTFGEGKFQAYVDYDNYTLYVETSVDTQSWYHEIAVTISKMKPANLIYINKPLISAQIHLSEQISSIGAVYNYRLGTSWILGRKPFAIVQDKGVAKLPTTQSISSNYLTSLAQASVSDIIKKVKLNGSVVLTDFSKLENTQGIITIEYELDSLVVSTITNIELLDGSNNVLASSIVYIPISGSTIVKHTINIKEGV